MMQKIAVGLGVDGRRGILSQVDAGSPVGGEVGDVVPATLAKRETHVHIVEVQMSQQKDVFLIHGVENKIDTTTYFNGFCDLIVKNMALEEKGNVRFHPVDYSSILDDRENVIYSWMKQDHWQKLRWAGAKLICDVLAYAYPKRMAQAGDVIFDITKLLSDKFVEVSSQYPSSEKWIIGHSLGCVVGFGFSWDVQINGLITMGNPHDYFSIRYKNFGEDNQDLPNFINFHDPWDPISTRVSKNPNFKRVTDVMVSNWNPLLKLPIRAHTAYWSNDQVAHRIASILTATRREEVLPKSW